LYERDGDEANPADEERHLGYFLAEKVDAQLGKMQTKLSSLVDRLNKQFGGSDDNPISLIVETLNAHLNALQWIDLNAATLQQKVTQQQKVHQQRSISFGK
jgi:nuclear pore complex protein Nup62